jgi:hypothetical protein
MEKKKTGLFSEAHALDKAKYSVSRVRYADPSADFNYATAIYTDAESGQDVEITTASDDEEFTQIYLSRWPDSKVVSHDCTYKKMGRTNETVVAQHPESKASG